MFFANRPIEERIERPPLLFELLLKTANPLLVRCRRKTMELGERHRISFAELGQLLSLIRGVLRRYIEQVVADEDAREVDSERSRRRFHRHHDLRLPRRRRIATRSGQVGFEAHGGDRPRTEAHQFTSRYHSSGYSELQQIDIWRIGKTKNLPTLRDGRAARDRY